jgi:hypothetical protein
VTTAYLRELDRELQHGAIDMHVHTAPCPFPRPYDDEDIAHMARERGFRAVVFKDHHQPTTGRVHYVKKAVPGIQACGSLVLTTYCGGLNVPAVETAIRFYDAKVIWLPTITSELHLQRFGYPGFKSYNVMPSSVEPTKVVENGILRKEVAEIVSLCKKNEVCLGTGHISADEIRLVISECQRQDFRKLLITHPLFEVPKLTLEEQKEFAASEGVFFEYTYLPMTPLWGQGAKQTAEAIAAVGPEKCVLSSDMGNYLNQPSPEAMRAFMQLMLHCGIACDNIYRMAKDNPSYLLSLR